MVWFQFYQYISIGTHKEWGGEKKQNINSNCGFGGCRSFYFFYTFRYFPDILQQVVSKDSELREGACARSSNLLPLSFFMLFS